MNGSLTIASAPESQTVDPVLDPSASCAPAVGEPDLTDEAIAMLRQLARGAMAMAETVQRQAAERAQREHEDGIQRADLTMAFSRAARAVRLTLALAARLDEARRKRGQDDAAERVRRADAALAEHKARERQRVESIVTAAVEGHESLTEVEAGDALAEFDELIETPEIQAQLGLYPAEEIAGRLLGEIDRLLDYGKPLAGRVAAAVETVRIEETRLKPAVLAQARTPLPGTLMTAGPPPATNGTGPP